VDTLDNDIKFVAGVGEARAKLLERELGIRTLGDMLSHYPFRYIDRTRIYRIAEITEAAGLSYVQFRARITGVAYAGTGRKRRFTAFAQDPTGQAELVWFQGVKWIEKRIEVGREYLVFGRPSFYRGELSVAHPELETMEQALSRKAESGMQGIYPSTEKLGNVLGAKGMYQIICNAWTLVKDRIADPLPEAVRTRYGLIGLRDAIYNIHFPQSQEALRQGTLFPGLDLPFHKELRSRFPQVDGPLLELMALDFAIDELGLYLTTHADDQQALELYWSYIRLGQEGRKRYQEKCGPLMQTDITPGSYQWLNDPWPWDGKGN